MVRELLTEINRIRADVRRPDRVDAWSECNEALYDLLLPWWKDDADWKAKWENRNVAVVEIEKGVFQAAPTAQDCREAQMLLMELLDDNKMLVKTRKTSGPAPREYAEAEAA